MVIYHSVTVGLVVGYHEVVGTLKPYLAGKDLYGLFSLTGGGPKNYRWR